MSSVEAVDRLMREIGPALDLTEVFAYDGARAWRLAFDSHAHVHVEYDSTSNLVVFQSPIARLPAGRSALIELLLRYNAEWRATGNARMARDADGHVSLLVDLPAAELSLPRLCELLERIRDVRAAWQQILEDETPQPAPCPSNSLQTHA